MTKIQSHFAWVAFAALTVSSIGAWAAEDLTCQPFETRSSGESREAYNIDYNDDGAASRPATSGSVPAC